MGGMTRDLATVTDRIPDDGETVVASGFTEQPGGKGASAAVACYRLTRSNPKNRPEGHEEDMENDIHVRMIGAVDANEFGQPMKDNLINCGVNVDGVMILEGQATVVANIILEKNLGANRIMQYPGASSTRNSTRTIRTTPYTISKYY